MGAEKKEGWNMSDNEQLQEIRIPMEEGQIIKSIEISGARIRNSFETGLLFGLGFGLAVILYGLIWVIVVKQFLSAVFMP